MTHRQVNHCLNPFVRSYCLGGCRVTRTAGLDAGLYIFSLNTPQLDASLYVHNMNNSTTQQQLSTSLYTAVECRSDSSHMRCPQGVHDPPTQGLTYLGVCCVFQDGSPTPRVPRIPFGCSVKLLKPKSGKQVVLATTTGC